MSLLKFASIKLTLLLVIGILLGSFFDINIVISGVLTVVFLIALGLCFYTKKENKTLAFGILTIGTTICLGVLVTALNNPKNDTPYFGNKLAKKPQLYTLKITETLKSNTYYRKYIADVKLVNTSGSSGKILLNIAKDSSNASLSIDDEIQTYILPKSLPLPLNPYQFNYKKYMENLGIYHQANISKSNYLLLRNSSSTLFGIASKIRKDLISKLKKHPFGTEELSIIQALLLGQRQDISNTTYDQYKKAGAIHILAVSGLHIGILLLILEFLLQPLEYLPHGKKIKLGLLVLLLWYFALVTGFSASIIRATTMFTFVAYALYLNRPSNTFNILALSMGFILLVINPNLIFQVGFQMSYAAVFAIVWLFPMLQRFWFPKNIVLNKIWQLLSVSIAAQLGVLPISLFYFHQFPSLFFISNLVVIPFLGIILGFGIFIILLAAINWLPTILVHIYNLVISTMNNIIAWVAAQETFLFTSVSFNKIQVLLSYGLLILFVNALTETTFKKVALFLTSIMLWQIVYFYQDNSLQKEEQVWVLHQSKNSILLHQKGKNLHVMSTRGKIATPSINAYQIEKNIDSTVYNLLSNSYSYGLKTFTVIDSSGMYSNTKKPSVYLLSNSPKINLSRFIDSVKPIKIIADGSNYKSYITRWKKTCKKRKLPFHYTGEKGAYLVPNTISP
ncbi:ComEC/Rec2 family competence protein [uncultured Maribacter sp.]|uniref:ComEC/Rec2 family competence protein n=1 Tax=uncultured Maribacter sp. TaxID=431308 RepID=UPI00260CBFCB|nr:ComEC/Rec2 family competence protein [uncultured Maribacter sp.]